MGASQSTEIQIFNGGINLIPAAHLLNPTESRVLSGANVRKGNMSPFSRSSFVEAAQGEFSYYYGEKFHYYDAYRSNVLYNRVWYWTSQFSAGKQYADGTVKPLGIPAPLGRMVAVSQSDPDGGLTGAINYVYTYYDTKTGSESPPSLPSNTLDLVGTEADKAVQLSNITESPDGYKIRLYRIGGLQTMYSTVETLPDGTTDYIDNKSYSEIEGMILDTLRAYPPPSGLQYLTLHQGRFFGSVNAQLVFSAPGKPDSWYALDFIAFDDVITGIVSVANGLIVMSKHKTWLVTGMNPMQFSMHILSNSEGCLTSKTIAVQDGTAIWLSSSGFLISNGSRIDNISLYRIGKLSSIEPYGAVYVNKRYMVSFGGALYPSEDLFPSDDLHPGDIVTDSGFSISKGAIVIDMSSGTTVFSTITDPSMGYLLEASNEIYHITNEGVNAANIITEDGTGRLVTETGFSNIIAAVNTGNSLSKTLGGEGLREINYLSPVFTEGAIAVLKQYEKIRLVYSGIGSITALDEDSKIFIKHDLEAGSRKTEWIYIPVTFNRGYGIQFRLSGTLIVDSLQWIWTPKEAQ